MPVDDGVDAHKGGPVAVGRVEVGEGGAVGVCPAGADKDGPEAGPVAQVGVEGGAHGQRVAGQVEVVGGGRVLDEGVDLGEGVGGHDVDGLQGGGKGPRRPAAHRGRGGGRVGRDLRGQAVGGGPVCIGRRRRVVVLWWLKVPREAGEDQDEEHEAVLAAVVGEGELLEAVCGQGGGGGELSGSKGGRSWAGWEEHHSPISVEGLVNDGYCLSRMGLHAPQEARLGLVGQEGVDLCLQLEADLAQRERWWLFDPAIRGGRDAVGEMVMWHHKHLRVCVRARGGIVSCFDPETTAMDTGRARC